MTDTAPLTRSYLICCGSANKLVSVTDPASLAGEVERHCSSIEVPFPAVARAWDTGAYASPDGRMSINVR